MISCSLCGFEGIEGRLGDTTYKHDCVGRRLDAALAKERSRIACVIRRVGYRWKERGALDVCRLLEDVANAIEQETA